MVSPSLQDKVKILIFSKIIQKNYRFNTVFTTKQQRITDTLNIKDYVADKGELVNIMVNKFLTELREPEYKIVEQYDSTDALFIIAKGECSVEMLDHKQNLNKLRRLRPGDFFGEISLLYGCERTADVISQKYSTLAKLRKEDFALLLYEFPELTYELKQSIFGYDDPMKNFIMETINFVDYFKGVSKDAAHDIMYNLQTQKFNSGDILQKPGDNADTLYFLIDGVIEVMTYTDRENEFIIERLFRGSVVNYRTFFMPDNGKVYYRFGKNSICQSIHIDKFETLMDQSNYPIL